MNIYHIIGAFGAAISLFDCGSGATGGGGGTGGEMAVASSGADASSSSSSMEPPLEGCAAAKNPDASCSDSNLCTNDTCEIHRGYGFCKHEPYSPEAVCGGGGRCYQGGCCFTCLIDSTDPTSKIGTLDKGDGPCTLGTQDTYCGLGGVMCVDCTVSGEVCRGGKCVPP